MMDEPQETLRDKQNIIHQYLKQQKQDLVTLQQHQNKQIRQDRKQELQSIKVQMSNGQCKHHTGFRKATKVKELFSKAGFLPLPSQVEERDSKLIQKSYPIVPPLKSALSGDQHSTKVRSVRFIEANIRIEDDLSQKKNSKPSSVYVDSERDNGSSTAWLPTCTISRMFQDRPPTQVLEFQDVSEALVRVRTNKSDWLPTSTRPLSSTLSIQHQIPTQSDHPYVAVKNNLLYQQHSRVKSSMVGTKFLKLEPFKPGNMVSKVFGDPKTALPSFKPRVNATLANIHNSSYM